MICGKHANRRGTGTACSGSNQSITTELLIEGAVVTSTHSRSELIGPDSDREIPASQSRFTIADGTSSIEVFLDVGGVAVTPDFEVKAGMVVSLTATQLDRYQGKAQIKRAVCGRMINRVAHQGRRG